MRGKKELFTITGDVYIPYYSRWAELTYHAKGSFHHNPFEIHAVSTSGSPVIFSDNVFIGFLNDTGGTYAFDGAHMIEVSFPPTQELFVRMDCDPFSAWAEYNLEVIRRLGIRDRSHFTHYRQIEYCTWVEQKAANSMPTRYSSQIFDENMLLDNMERLGRLNLPIGKLTLDHGWYDTHSINGSGTFEPCDRFPNFWKLPRMIEAAGYIPGVWLDIGSVSPFSEYYAKHHQLVKPHSWHTGEHEREGHPMYQALTGTVFSEHLRKVFGKLIEAGFAKFKLDLLYGNKREMKEILSVAYQIAHDLRPDVEIECHIPDIFVSQYCDVVRTNDVVIHPSRDWRNLTLAHWTVSHFSSPYRWLNLDHIGGDDPTIDEACYIEHMRMYDRVPGHPVVSLLPDRYSEDVQDQLRDLLESYQVNHNDPSYFTNIPKNLA